MQANWKQAIHTGEFQHREQGQKNKKDKAKMAIQISCNVIINKGW